MAITFDPAKRAVTLRERNLDFADAGKVFAGVTVEFEDDRFDYGEVRIVSIGLLGTKVVVIVWTDRGDDQHIISMRLATKGEANDYYRTVG
jgi:uncharacterized DUF497 family protein